MIDAKPDWVLSRQRAWGVPIAVFVREKADGSAEILQDEAVNQRIADAFEQEGADAWYMDGARERFLGPLANEEWKKVDDICDVWFDSGSTHAFVLEDPVHFPGLAGIRRKVDGGDDTVMYLEGSRPAPRLVPVVAAGKLRHPRPRAVRRRAHPRLHARRERPQNVEVDRQHRRAAKGDRAIRRRHPAAVGLRDRLCRRPAHRSGNPQKHHRDLPQAAQLDPLDARHAASFQAGRRGRSRRDARTGAADAASARRPGDDRAQGLCRVRLQDRGRQPVGVHEHRTVGVLFRYPQGHAVLRPAVVAGAQGRADRPST